MAHSPTTLAFGPAETIMHRPETIPVNEEVLEVLQLGFLDDLDAFPTIVR